LTHPAPEPIYRRMKKIRALVAYCLAALTGSAFLAEALLPTAEPNARRRHHAHSGNWSHCSRGRQMPPNTTTGQTRRPPRRWWQQAAPHLPALCPAASSCLHRNGPSIRHPSFRRAYGASLTVRPSCAWRTCYGFAEATGHSLVVDLRPIKR
jgi:hypothetical protein